MKHGFTMVMEETMEVSPDKLKIIKESKNSEGVDKITFKVPLQDAEKVNGNRRFYSRETCSNIVESLKAQVKNGLLQEVDHPMGSGDDDSLKKRALQIEIKNCGSVIRDIYMEGNDIYGIVETLTGFKGPDLRDLIAKDKVNIGFSLRMLSRVQPHPRYENVMEVLAPLRPVTYDVVSNPSHAKARVLQFTTESQSLQALLSDEHFIMESESFFSDENIKHPGSSKELLTQYLNELVKESFDELRNMKFKIG